ncbi:MAG: hypothetical protein IKH10_05180 [Bacteroidetes bacterium]|nr:hypothetical protein [Bacteroidota bacterium]
MIYDDTENSLLGDQKTIDGFFKNFQYSYNFKDTITYSNLLNDDFIFTYRNYDAGIDASWSRQEDIYSTYRLFMAAQNLDLIWNEILSQSGDSLQLYITRSFNLSITFSPSDIVRIYGKANFFLTRNDTNSIWKLSLWKDDSAY